MPRPGALTAAAVLWTITAGFLSLSYGFSALTAFGYGEDTLAALAGFWAAGSVVLWRLGSGLRHGRDNRAALTVLGLVVGLGLIPLVIVAIVLQYLPACRRWFALPPAEAP